MVRWKRSYREYLKRYKPVVSLPHPFQRPLRFLQTHCENTTEAQPHLPLHLIHGQSADKSVSGSASTAMWSGSNFVPTGVFTLRTHTDGFYGVCRVWTVWICNMIWNCACVRVGSCTLTACFNYVSASFSVNCLWSCSYTLRVLKYIETPVMCHVINATLLRKFSFSESYLIQANEAVLWGRNLCCIRLH